MNKYHLKDKRPKSLELHRIISNIKNLKKRNLIRGYSVKDHLNVNEIDTLRKNNSLHDCMIIGAALKGKGGLLQDKIEKKQVKIYI